MESIDRLKIKLGLASDDASQDNKLTQYLLDAEDAIKLFLYGERANQKTLGSIFVSKQIEIAKIYYQKDQAEKSNVKSESYSEGPVSENTTYVQASDFKTRIDQALDDIKQYRRVYVRNSKKNQRQESTD